MHTIFTYMWNLLVDHRIKKFTSKESLDFEAVAIELVTISGSLNITNPYTNIHTKHEPMLHTC